MAGLRRRELILAGIGLILGSCAYRSSYRNLNIPGCEYVIRSGDSLAEIARLHRADVRAILRHNNLPDGELRVGQRIFIPGGRPPILPTRPMSPRGYQLVRRQVWGALTPKPNHDPMNGIHCITLHHTSEYAGMRHHSDLQAVQYICHLHRDRHGWADIGYHFLIGRDGRVYEGRPIGIQGAHCGGTNNCHNLGISLIGDFCHRPPTGAQERTLRAFLADMQRRYRVPTTRIYGHRDFKNTECPGNSGYRWLMSYKRRQDLVAQRR